jgi:methionyl aminopeptidase
VGNVLALEPMITMGSAQTVVLDDDWSVATADKSWASHWEHTVAITPSGPQILTLP